jgi:hypothetical protein
MDMMNSLEEQLIELLRRCTVRLSVPDGHGTGFFVAPGKILSCAHVVKPAQEAKKAVTAFWNGQAYIASIQYYLGETHSELQMLYPDLAVLKVDNLSDHPCVYLHEEAHLGDKFYSYGFIDDYKGGDPATFVSEGWTDERKMLKLKAGQAQAGMSGAPVLNLRTGGVCGVMKRSRGVDSDLGGRAVPVSIVFQEFSELVEQQKLFHQRDKRWYDCLTQEQREKLGMVTSQEAAGTLEVFYSYAEEDEKLAKELQKQLTILKRLSIINEWHPGKVVPNEEPGEQVMKHLNTARIILLLISPDFMYSEQHGNVEVKLAMERSKAGAVVIPVNLRRIDYWEATPFGKLLTIPRNGTPVTEWGNRDAAFAEVAKEIRRAVESLRKKPNP